MDIIKFSTKGSGGEAKIKPALYSSGGEAGHAALYRGQIVMNNNFSLI